MKTVTLYCSCGAYWTTRDTPATHVVWQIAHPPGPQHYAVSAEMAIQNRRLAARREAEIEHAKPAETWQEK